MSGREARGVIGPVHFMGAGGAGMCALAEAMARAGLDVSGCDASPSRSLRDLESHGVAVHVGHDPVHAAGAATLVHTAAVPSDHPELQAARGAGLRVMKRAEALGEWVSQGRLVGVAGTHGKTTTTAMITTVLAAGDLDPTGFVGGRVAGWGGNLRPGSRNLFVVEADEYDRSFHWLATDAAVVTNMEPDHLDIYGDEEGVREGFRTFLDGLREGGRVIVCADDPGASSLAAGLGHPATTYGLSAGAQLRGEAPRTTGTGTRCRVVEEGVVLGSLEVPVPGLHNLRNALAAVAVARFLGMTFESIAEGLSGFGGVGRRFQTLGESDGVTVVDDYAHHPTEVEATLAAARASFPERRIVAVFQPHLYSRTHDFHEEFGVALAAADVVWLTDVYPAREEPIPGVDGELVAESTRAAGHSDVRYEPSLEALPAAVAASLRAGDLCLTLGAGSIEHTGPAILEALEVSHV
jgi:UDP-N-acetylmuramate--alanine ligase